jgi:uncharacterized membrane protein HdeD (DUF308 family)
MAEARAETVAYLKEVWGLLLAMGVGLAVVGLLAISSAFIATMAVVFIFGIELILGAVFQMVASVLARSWKGFTLNLLCGVLYLVAGIILFDHPVAVAAGITLVIAVGLLVGGILRVVMALTDRFEGWPLVMLTGVISILLGASIWRSWPYSTAWVIGLFVGIELLFTGVAWILLALAVRQASPTASAPAAA